jgi:DNA-binding NarL/FixJ family response regulator
MTTLRVLLGEDHAVVREGTRKILEAVPGMDVIGEAGDGEQAVAMAARLRPDVVLLDLGLPVLNGIEATRRIVSLTGRPRVLILSAFDDVDYVVAAIEAGASGYVLKSASAVDVVAAIGAVQVLLEATGELSARFSVRRNMTGMSEIGRSSLQHRSPHVRNSLSETLHRLARTVIGTRGLWTSPGSSGAASRGVPAGCGSSGSAPA